MNILCIHQIFASMKEAGGTRHYELAQHLRARGHQMVVIAGTSSYLSNERLVTRKRLVTEDAADGIRILRAYTWGNFHRSFAKRIVAFLSFMLTSVWASLRVHEVDLILATSPPLFQALSAWVVSCLRRRPLLLEIRDLWPDFAIGMGILKNPILISLARTLERFLYSRAAHIIVNSPAYVDYMIARGIPQDKVSLIPNGVSPEMFVRKANGASIRTQYGLQDKFVVTYAGAHGVANDLEVVVLAAERVRSDPSIHFLFVGSGAERVRLEALARSLNLKNVTFAGPCPKSEIPQILAASDACLAILQNIPMFQTTYPNKVFDYMAAGRPTILAINGVIRKVIEESHGGIYVPPGDAAALSEAVRVLSRNRQKAAEMGRAAREFVIERFNRKDHAQKLERLLLALTRRKVPKDSLYLRHGKRPLDLLLVFFSLPITLPMSLLLGFLVRMFLGRPILFVQRRPGRHGKPFWIYKFRTMADQCDSCARPLPDDQRLTRFGRYLRATSLDEIPTLFNVLKGDMSLVGPRPLLMEYLKRYTAEQAHRHDILPGITGRAQVNGRNAIGWDEKFRCDIWYVEHCAFLLDLKILAKTVLKVFAGSGVCQQGYATMPEFMGSQSHLHEIAKR